MFGMDIGEMWADKFRDNADSVAEQEQDAIFGGR